MLCYLTPILCDFFRVIILDTHVQKDLKQETKIKQGKIDTVAFIAYTVLHLCIYAQDIERFNQEINPDKQKDVFGELFLQLALIKTLNLRVLGYNARPGVNLFERLNQKVDGREIDLLELGSYLL